MSFCLLQKHGTASEPAVLAQRPVATSLRPPNSMREIYLKGRQRENWLLGICQCSPNRTSTGVTIYQLQRSASNISRKGIPTRSRTSLADKEQQPRFITHCNRWLKKGQKPHHCGSRSMPLDTTAHLRKEKANTRCSRCGFACQARGE